MTDNDLKAQSPLALDKMFGAKTWVFDLDNTLYPAACGLFRQVEQNMTRYIMDRLELGREDAYAVQKTYFREHGTTMRGLMHHHAVDPLDFLAYVHDIDLSPIPVNPVLNDLLTRLPGRKIIFTNGSTGHAENITRHMGIDHHFEAVFDIVAADYIPKPEKVIYERLVDSHTIDPDTTVMVEDMAKNLAPAAEIGMTTVWIETDTTWGREHADSDFVHHRAPDINTFLSDVLGD